MKTKQMVYIKIKLKQKKKFSAKPLSIISVCFCVSVRAHACATCAAGTRIAEVVHLNNYEAALPFTIFLKDRFK